MTEKQDRHLQSPGEANRDKHINFLAIEQGDVDPASENTSSNNDDISETDNDENNTQSELEIENGFFKVDDDAEEKDSKTENNKAENDEEENSANEVFKSALGTTKKDNLTARNSEGNYDEKLAEEDDEKDII
ncbi:MAG: hypothetical protein ACR2FN_07100 [Chitinophagaceae bacterium]